MGCTTSFNVCFFVENQNAVIVITLNIGVDKIFRDVILLPKNTLVNCIILLETGVQLKELQNFKKKGVLMKKVNVFEIGITVKGGLVRFLDQMIHVCINLSIVTIDVDILNSIGNANYYNYCQYYYGNK